MYIKFFNLQQKFNNSKCHVETIENENHNLIIFLSRWMPTEYFSYLSTPII